MWRKRFPLYSLIALLCFLDCKPEPKTPSQPKKTTNAIFEANWESIKKNYSDPKWFNEAKFGIFIHWGVYSVPAHGSEWYPRGMYMDAASYDPKWVLQENKPNPTYLYHKETWGTLEEFGYKDFIPLFKAEAFNAKEWIRLFKEAGARYVIPVADHHDGFAMYRSNTTPFNAVNMGPKRDVLGELFKEGRQQGLIMGASSHYAYNWTFYNKKNDFDTMDPKYRLLYSPKGKENGEAVTEEFKALWWRRTTDLIDNYEPDILWFDFYLDIPDFAELRPKIAAYYYNKGLEWGKKVVINDKNFEHEAFPKGTVIYDLERGKLPGIHELPWQTDTSIGKNSWGYVTNWQSKTTNELVDDLVDIVSKNGNLLLNVGPKADGTIPDDQKLVLKEMGNWLAINGEAIYKTSPWKTYGEGPTAVNKGHHTEGRNSGFTSKDIRFTKKDGVLYAILLAWPNKGSIEIRSLNQKHLEKRVNSISLLGSDQELSFKQFGDRLLIQGFVEKSGDFAHVLKLTFSTTE